LEATNHEHQPGLAKRQRYVRRGYARTEQETIDDDLGVCIYLTARSPKWYMQFNSPSGQRKESLKTTSKKKAKRLASLLATRLRAGDTEAARTRALIVNDAVDKFLKNKERIGRRVTTVTEYSRALRQFCEFCKGQRVLRLDQVTEDHLENFEQRLREHGIAIPREKKGRGRPAKPNKSTSIHEKVKLVKSLMKWAVKRRLLRENPVAAYELPAEGTPDTHCYSVSEVGRICDAAGEFFGRVFQFLALTGLRQGELMWLEKTDFNMKQRLLQIRSKTIREEGLGWAPKTDDRFVPLSQPALAIAERMHATSTSRWLFTAPPAPGVKDARLHASRLWAQLKKAKKLAGVSRGTVHGFRHFFVSTMANANVSPFKVMKIVGHKSLDIILTYYHVSSEELLSAVDGVNFAITASSSSLATGPANAAGAKTGQPQET